MANIDKSKLINNDKEQTNNKNSTKMVIITTIDDDDGDNKNDILSFLNPTSIQTILVDINETNSIDTYQIHNQQQSLIKIETPKNERKRKADLTCVVCGGKAIGYNFSQITCESCKAFFRRNALHPLDATKCLKDKNNFNEILCDIQHNTKHKCQRCRLLKCLYEGMSKDYILTPEQKQTKIKRLEENRQLRSTIIDNEKPTSITEYHKPVNELVNISSHSISLNKSDWLCLTNMQNAYLSATQSTPLASSIVSFELGPDKLSAFMNTIDIQNFTAVKLITFLKEIPEFEQLDEHDRLILVKYNLMLLILIRHSLTFDPIREIIYDLDSPDIISPTDEAFAQHCKSLFILCYGYEFNRAAMSVLHGVIRFSNKNPMITQLLMLIMIFSKGISANDDQQPMLNDEKSVFYAQSKYTDLLFRYLMEDLSFEIVTMKMTSIIEQLLKIQKICRDFQQYIKEQVDVTYINPLMKSLLHLT